MTDIVERLRELATTKTHGLDKMWQGMRDAAAEIERLEEQKGYWQNLAIERHDEIDRLRGLVAQYKKWLAEALTTEGE